MLRIPNKNQAIHIFEEAIIKNENNNPVFSVETWIKHSYLTAEMAEKIASKLPELDSKAAYIMGLMHDIGKRWSEEDGKSFHGLSGYYHMKSMGFDDSATICLTHTFVARPIDADNYFYNPNLLNIANKLLKGYNYNDYDRLIQLCDWLNKGGVSYTLEQRAQEIITCYPINGAKILKTYQSAKTLKAYFDYKINQDLYHLLNIREK